MTLHIGFTGTRRGMTTAQFAAIRELIGTPDFDYHDHWTIHHGDCVGADAEFHALMTTMIGVRSVIHPGPIGEYSAGCVGDERREPWAHMRRNRAIVAAATVMIAAPAEMLPRKRGGTWATIGFTRRAKKPLAIVWPDGTVTKERWP
jgi:hypothetical protein